MVTYRVGYCPAGSGEFLENESSIVNVERADTDDMIPQCDGNDTIDSSVNAGGLSELGTQPNWSSGTPWPLHNRLRNFCSQNNNHRFSAE